MRVSWKKIILIVLTSPILIWLILNINTYINEWKNLSSDSLSISKLIDPDKVGKLNEVRWNAFSDQREDLLATAYYNKGYLIVDNFFSYLSYLSPRLYFQSSDNTNMSPNYVEPIGIILFPFFVFGISKLTREKKWKFGISILIFVGVAFFLGKRNFAFLMPTIIAILFIVYKGFPKKLPLWLTLSVTLYGVFLLMRMLWLKS